MASITTTLHTSRHFGAPPETIYDAWLDPIRVGAFFFGHPQGRMVRAELEPRVGGRYRFVDRRGGTDVEHTGEYHELIRPTRLTFTFAVPDLWPGVTRVVLRLRDTPGGCDLSLTQSGVHPAYAESSAAAWELVFDRLDRGLVVVD